MDIFKYFASGAAQCALATCGDTFSEQTLVGAWAGAATSIVLDGSPYAGPIISNATNVVYC